MISMKIGKSHVFERTYMGKFQELAARFGEIVKYERDSAARDIGLHLARKRADGLEELSSTLSWFQMKGITKGVLSAEEYAKADHVKLRLEVRHLSFWCKQPMPTYLVVFIEAMDLFLVMDIQAYVKSEWGNGI